MASTMRSPKASEMPLQHMLAAAIRPASTTPTPLHGGTSSVASASSVQPST